MASMMTCRVHPVVMLGLVDAHERRTGKESKAIGTLLGWWDKRVVELTAAYSVPFSEERGEPEIDMQYNNDMYELHRKSASELPVGWFYTNTEVTANCIHYHDYYSDFSRVKQEKRDQVPVVLLTLDGELKSGRLEMKAHLRAKAGVPGAKSPHSAIFLPLKVELALFEPEATCLDLVTSGLYNQTRQVRMPTGLGQLHESLDEMAGWLGDLRTYVADVVAGKRAGDAQMGRRLMALVTSVAKVQPAKFETMVNGSVKDFLMVFYLMQLAKTQLTLHEKMLTVSS